MKEFNNIIKAYDEGLAEGKKIAICSIVHLEGSSYRRPGARMLIDDKGQLTGAISGGCLEGDALRRAMLVLHQQQSKLVTYDTSNEDEASIGAQLGCEGIIQVLFEPIIDTEKVNPIVLLKKIKSKRQCCLLVTLFDVNAKNNSQLGTCLLLESDGSINEHGVPLAIKDQVIRDARWALEQQKSSFVHYDSAGNTFTAHLEYIAPPISMVVIGAGNDAIPMVAFADALGWEVAVVDGRKNVAKKERFSSTCQVVVSKPEHSIDHIVVDRHTVFVLMSHNYNYDLAMLKVLMPLDIQYIGLLGPKKKLNKMIEDLKAEGIEISKNQMQKIYGPVGLEIGAETAEEIALSIIAEIKAVFTGTKGGMLREKEEAIHAISATKISQR